jgi:hypothetical protein
MLIYSSIFTFPSFKIKDKRLMQKNQQKNQLSILSNCEGRKNKRLMQKNQQKNQLIIFRFFTHLVLN